VNNLQLDHLQLAVLGIFIIALSAKVLLTEVTLHMPSRARIAICCYPVTMGVELDAARINPPQVISGPDR
jgi:hypothetical protein